MSNVRPLLWRPFLLTTEVFRFGVDAYRYLGNREREHLIEWCVDNVGCEANFRIDDMGSWLLIDPNEAFCFKKEADMVMFVLAHTKSE